MRFIGSKVNLLDELSLFISENAPATGVFCDIFSGTGAVAKHFKMDYSIISNDIMRFSYVLQSATIENNGFPYFKGLKKLGIDNPLHYLNTSDLFIPNEPFIRNNFSPFNGCERMYLSVDNATRIDFIRQKINTWLAQSVIDQYEFNYLLACLIEAVPFVSNIAGTYGAFLKHWDKRALQRIQLFYLDVQSSQHSNICYNQDSKQLIKKISGDILYIDPPYNSRQYLPNYHLLETIACYDYPELTGKTGLRSYRNQKSEFCSIRTVAIALDELVSSANFTHIFLSYSSEGLLSKNEIINILSRYAKKQQVKLKEIPYRRYQHIKSDRKKDLVEYIFHIEKL